MSPPSGEDTLTVRHNYLRRRHGRHFASRRTALWIILGAAGCGLCITGIGGLVIGS